MDFYAFMKDLIALEEINRELEPDNMKVIVAKKTAEIFPDEVFESIKNNLKKAIFDFEIGGLK